MNSLKSEVLKNQSKLSSRLNNRLNIFLFNCAWFWISFVSSFDAYLTVRLRNTIRDSEENPIARYIMSLDNWDVSLFIGFKMFGTLLALWILHWLFTFNKKIAMVVAFAIAIFQAFLMFYFFYDRRIGSFSLSLF